jgi:hypothetical protein
MTNALPPGPPEVPQQVWDAVIAFVSFGLGWLWRHLTKTK